MLLWVVRCWSCVCRFVSSFIRPGSPTSQRCRSNNNGSVLHDVAARAAVAVKRPRLFCNDLARTVGPPPNGQRNLPRSVWPGPRIWWENRSERYWNDIILRCCRRRCYRRPCQISAYYIQHTRTARQRLLTPMTATWHRRCCQLSVSSSRHPSVHCSQQQQQQQLISCLHPRSLPRTHHTVTIDSTDSLQLDIEHPATCCVFESR